MFNIIARHAIHNKHGQTQKAMLDQKQNWLVSGAYLSNIFRLERHRNHHVETHAQTHSHTKRKIATIRLTRRSVAERCSTLLPVMQCTTNMDKHRKQCSIRSRTGLYLVLICHTFSEWSGTEIITSRLMPKHTHIQNAKLQPFVLLKEV